MKKNDLLERSIKAIKIFYKDKKIEKMDIMKHTPHKVELNVVFKDGVHVEYYASLYKGVERFTKIQYQIVENSKQR